MSLLSLTEPLEFIPSGSMLEKNLPEVFFAAMLADELTDGLTLTLKDGVYHKRLRTSRERVEKLLNKISATHYLIATANSTREDEYAEFCKKCACGVYSKRSRRYRSSDYNRCLRHIFFGKALRKQSYHTRP